LSIDTDGIIYGWENVYQPQGEKHLRAFWKMSPKGEFTGLVSLTENPPSGMSIWRDAGGSTYAVEPWNNEKKESKIIKRTADGKTSLFAGGKHGYLDGMKDKAEFGGVMDMAFGKDNAIYLTDDNRIRRIEKAGLVKTIYSDEAAAKNQKNSNLSSRLYGLDVDKDNNVLAADFGNSRVLKINSDGAVSTFLSSEKDWSPLGVAIFGDEVYVLEGRPFTAPSQSGVRVIKVSATGKSTVIANLEDRNKRIENPNSNAANQFSPIEEEKNLSGDMDTISVKSTANPIGSYGILMAAGIAFFALIILVRKK